MQIDCLGDMAMGKDFHSVQYMYSQSTIFELHSAVYNGELTKVKLLVEVFHLSPLEVNRYGLTALHVAAASGELNLLKYLVELFNAAATELVDEDSTTPLHYAAQNGHMHIVKYLVEDQLIDPLILDGQLKTPLHTACVGGHLNTVKYLIDRGRMSQTIEDEETKHGLILLHFAAWSGNLSVVSYILAEFYQDIKSDVNKGDKVNHINNYQISTMRNHTHSR